MASCRENTIDNEFHCFEFFLFFTFLFMRQGVSSARDGENV